LKFSQGQYTLPLLLEKSDFFVTVSLVGYAKVDNERRQFQSSKQETRKYEIQVIFPKRADPSCLPKYQSVLKREGFAVLMVILVAREAQKNIATIEISVCAGGLIELMTQNPLRIADVD
jgi:hypothetical protein